MKASEKNIAEIFTFKGSWGMESKCGLKMLPLDGRTIVIVTELYQDNPGSSITSVTASLAKQICDKFDIAPQGLIYIESSPQMNSKLAFYDEEYYLVTFADVDNFGQPSWKKMSKEEIKKYVG